MKRNKNWKRINNRNFFTLFFLIFFCLFFSLRVEGAVLFFEKSFQDYYLNDIFLIHLEIDTQAERINAVQAEINFPQEKLKVVDIIKENSIFSLWPEEPKLSNEGGKIFFVGGIPFGFEGKGKILTIAFKVISAEKEEIKEINFGENCMALLNDGLGSRAKLTTKNSQILIHPILSENPKNELDKILKNDTFSPEPFQIFLSKTPLIFNGKYFISFFALDFQSGIDHYEIKEGNGPWRKTNYNFYLLEDQTLKSEIKVKAIDKAGNEQISVLKLSQ